MGVNRAAVGIGALAAAGAIAVGVSNADASSSGSSAAVPAETGYAAAPQSSNDTPVTGDEASKVTAAVTAKDSAVSVTSVRKDPDGSYDVDGTKAGATVRFEVSADLATITQNSHS